MRLMLPTAQRVDGGEQPYIPLGLFKLRIPFVHFEWEIPEMIQAMVVFVTGVAATAYLQDIFGLPFEVALAVIVLHELLYALQNLFGDPIIGGWVTPALPLVTTFLLAIPDPTIRIQSLLALQLVLGILFIVLGVTGIAGKLIAWTPNSVKAGILIGAGIAAVIGKYGFMAADKGGVGFYKFPVAFSVGVLVSLWLLFSKGFRSLKQSDNKFLSFISKTGFVPGLLLAFIAGIAAGEIQAPVFTEPGIFFNPIPGLKYTASHFSILGLGLPPLDVIVSVIPLALVVYVIAFGDIIAGTEFLKETDAARTDEKIDVNPNRTNVACGVRNVVQSFVAPTATMSGPLWSAMMVTVAERYKTGKENMYSIFGGAATFNLTKFACCLIIPLIALVRPILPLSMGLTLLIQAFGCFYVAMKMCEDNQQRGVAGIVGAILAVTNPTVGLIAGVALAIVVEYLFNDKRKEGINNDK